jgi:selenocysteine lyase/cysteine desulfurase
VDPWDVWNLSLSKTASRFQIGTASIISLVGATEAMKMLLDFGTENIKRRIARLTDHLIDSIQNLGLKLQTPLEKPCRSGIVNFKINQPKKLAEKLNKKGIVISARSNGIRVAPHYYNTEEEVDKLMEEVKKAKG